MPKTRDDVEPWQDKETLEWAYKKRGTTAASAKTLGCSGTAVRRWMNRLDAYPDEEWKDEETLRTLYNDEEMTSAEIAAEFDVASSTIEYWFGEFDIGGHSCPTCGKTLPSEQGVKIHHKNVHGESLVYSGDIECPTCGRTDFENERGMKCHHKIAHDESLAGREIECNWCGETLRVSHHNARNADRHFCPDKSCQAAWRSQQYSGENHPHWKGGKQRYECENCRTSFRRKPSSVVGDHAFCGRDCYGSWESEQMTGSDHFNWKGGYEPHYGPGFGARKKRKVRIRDQARCQDCGMTEADHVAEAGQRLHVHHVVPAREFDDPEKRNAMANLITLCRDCHLNKWEDLPGLRPDSRTASTAD